MTQPERAAAKPAAAANNQQRVDPFAAQRMNFQQQYATGIRVANPVAGAMGYAGSTFANVQGQNH